MIRQERPDPSASLSVPTLGSGMVEEEWGLAGGFCSADRSVSGGEPDVHTKLRLEGGTGPGEENLIDKTTRPGPDIWAH